MAIYSLHHNPIGKTTQTRPFTASAHIRYISRRNANPHILTARMPETRREAMAFLDEGEKADRKNARVADKVLLALPRELAPDRRQALVQKFAERLSEGRASWFAAIHAQGKDAQNPHCHLLLRDRDHETGKRVFKTSERDSTERMREIWEECANAALAEAGKEERVDRRTLKAQGADREPTIHEGPKSQQMDRRGATPRSQNRERRNGIGARRMTRTVHYPNFDKGRSRPQHNRDLRSSALESAIWLELDSALQKEEMSALRAIHRPDSQEMPSLQSERRKWLRRPVSAIGKTPENSLDLEREP